MGGTNMKQDEVFEQNNTKLSDNELNKVAGGRYPLNGSHYGTPKCPGPQNCMSLRCGDCSDIYIDALRSVENNKTYYRCRHL